MAKITWFKELQKEAHKRIEIKYEFISCIEQSLTRYMLIEKHVVREIDGDSTPIVLLTEIRGGGVGVVESITIYKMEDL